jgi:hypothetical protein
VTICRKKCGRIFNRAKHRSHRCRKANGEKADTTLLNRIPRIVRASRPKNVHKPVNFLTQAREKKFEPLVVVGGSEARPAKQLDPESRMKLCLTIHGAAGEIPALR